MIEIEPRYYEYGNTKWFIKGSRVLHREDGPAVIWGDGSEEWYYNGGRHCNDGPAIIRSDGSEEWFEGDVLHRIDGPAWTCSNGNEEWWVEGDRHRTDGPAIKYGDHYKEWHHYGQLHREDGPAIEDANGKLDLYEWYLNGVQYNFNKWLELTPISNEERLMLKLKYA